MGEEDELRQQAEARVGVTLKDKWRLDTLLGVGGMASVYAATHHNQKRVAIKILHRDLSLHPDVRARFLREGYLANTVGHGGVVTVDDDNVLEDGSAFLVMELLEGETLEARRAKQGGTLPVGEVLGYAERLADVLVAAHDKGIVHRDLKPDNLFLTTSGELKVLDFGIARLQEMSASTGGTRVGAILGTPAFMAPEQARARWDEVDGRTDIFAVGATMYTLLSGRLVHEAGTVNEELGLAMTARAASLATVAPDLPAPVVAFVDRALAYEKAARWPDARTMRDVLGELRATSPAAGAAPLASSSDEASPFTMGPQAAPYPGLLRSPSPTPAAPKRAVSAGRAAMIAVAAAVVVGGLFAFRHGSAPIPPGPASAAEERGTAEPPTAQVPAASGVGSTVVVTPADPAPASAEPAAVPAAVTKGDDAASRKDSPKPPPAATPKAPVAATTPPKASPAATKASLFDRRH
jgi:serine/threonine-protein kinase